MFFYMTIYHHIIQNKRTQSIRSCKTVSKTCCQIYLSLLRSQFFNNLRNHCRRCSSGFLSFLRIIVFSPVSKLQSNIISNGLIHLSLTLFIFDLHRALPDPSVQIGFFFQNNTGYLNIILRKAFPYLQCQICSLFHIMFLPSIYYFCRFLFFSTCYILFFVKK